MLEGAGAADGKAAEGCRTPMSVVVKRSLFCSFSVGRVSARSSATEWGESRRASGGAGGRPTSPHAPRLGSCFHLKSSGGLVWVLEARWGVPSGCSAESLPDSGNLAGLKRFPCAC